MTSGQKTTLALVMLFAAAAYARNKLQKIETHSGASPGVVTIKGDDFQVATGGSNGDCLLWDDTTDAGVDWGACAAGGGDNVLVDTAATVDPDFQDGDVDFTYAAGVVTATVGCTGCIDATDLAANSLTPADLDTVAAAGAPEDEYCLTYEHGTTEFAWQTCGSGDSVTVNLAAAVNPDFADSDIDWSIASMGAYDQITATVGCSGCIDATDLAASSVGTSEIADGTIAAIDISTGAVDTNAILNGTITPDDLDDDAPTDEYCLTYESSTLDFQWQVCSSGGGDSITVNSGATVDPNFLNGDIDFTYTGTDITATVACSGCVDATDLANNSVDSAEIVDGAVGIGDIGDDAVGEAELKVTGAATDEYCLTYESGSGTFEWQVCASPCAGYPVDSVFISLSSTNPGTSLGCGTWGAFGTGRMLIGVDGGKTWSSAGATGGDADMQHLHQFTTNVAHSHAYYSATSSAGSATCYEHGTLDTSATCGETETTENSGGASPEDTGYNSTAPVPWIAVYMWRRTA